MYVTCLNKAATDGRAGPGAGEAVIPHLSPAG
jgi:hypothetical protein